jgi:hypothetical protein
MMLVVSILTWVCEVSEQWEFNHAMRFAVASFVVSIIFVAVAVRGKLGTKATSQDPPSR